MNKTREEADASRKLPFSENAHQSSLPGGHRRARCSFLLLALIALPGWTYGQEVKLPPGNLAVPGTTATESGDAPVTGSTKAPYVPNLDWSGGTIDSGTSAFSFVPSPVTADSGTDAAETPSFSLPGGYGRSPETIEPGGGYISHQGPPGFSYNLETRRIQALPAGPVLQRPIGFSFNVETGYDDNVLSSGNGGGATTSGTFSNSGGQSQGIIGSFVTNAFLSQRLDFLTKRNFLALDWNGGGSYFLDRPGGNFQPGGAFHLTTASKLSTRTLLSANINAGYFSNPNLTLINAPKHSGQGDYINTAGTIDLSYKLTKRYSLDTTLILGSQTFMDSSAQGANYLEAGLGEALRYVVTRRISAVLDMRATQSSYQDSTQDFDTQYLLLGFDTSFPHRFASAFRFGETIQEYRASGTKNTSSPFVESALSYGFGKASSLSWNNRYGYETQGSSSQPQLTYRTGLNASLVYSPKLTTSLGFDYSDSQAAGSSGQASEQTVNGTLGTEYTYSRWWSFYGKFIRSQVISGDPGSSYSRNQYFLGATYQF